MPLLVFLLCTLLCTAWGQTESFETQNFFPPNDWIIVNEDALDAIWYRAQGEAHTGQYAAFCYADTSYSGLTHTNLDYLITPRVMPQGADTLLSFWHISSSTAPCSLDVMACSSSPPSMTGFTLVQSFLLTNIVWTQSTVSLKAYSGTPLYIAFRARRIPLQNSIGLDDITLPAATTQPLICNGRLRSKGVPTQKYMHVWGTNYEMGFAHGYLIASEIMSAYLNKWIGFTSYHSRTPNSFNTDYLPMYREKYTVPTEFQEETNGIIDGIKAKGVSLYHPDMGRDLTAEDIWSVTGAGDTTSHGCSSVSGWGESTSGDDTLQGGLIIARNVDGTLGLYSTLANSSLIMAFSPSDPDKQRFFNVSFAGVYGVCSSINAQGVGLCSNAGNHPDTNAIPPNSLVGNLLSNRQAVESIDPDGNGVHDIYDIDSMKIHSRSLRSNEIHVYSQYNNDHPIPAAALEINNIGDTLRFSTDNFIAPQINSQWNLAVTNHDRLRYTPANCGRYQTITNMLNADFHLSTQRAMTIVNAAAVGYNTNTSGGTYHSMVLRPNIAVEHPEWPCVGISYTRRYKAAHTQEKIWYSWKEIFNFDDPVGSKEVIAEPARKKPIRSMIITGLLPVPPNNVKCRYYNSHGRELHTRDPGIGVYFIKVGDVITQKIIKVR